MTDVVKHIPPGFAYGYKSNPILEISELDEAEDISLKIDLSISKRLIYSTKDKNYGKIKTGQN